MKTSLRWCGVLLGGALLSCGRPAGPVDELPPVASADASVDAGEPLSGVDGSVADASVLDASVAAPDAGSPDASVPVADAGTPPFDAGSSASDGGTWKQRCFSGLGGGVAGPDYEQFHPSWGASHCSGTNQQTITGVQRVVFLGDSITVGTPPTASTDFYRQRLATLLASRFNLTAPDAVWATANPFSGLSGTKTSGDFSSCAKWGDRIKDLTGPGGRDQLAQCFGAVEPKKTLVVLTVGGNDFSDYAKAGMGGTPVATVLADVDSAIATLGRAVDALKDPVRFPNGSYVVVTNVYEYTDGTKDQGSCPTATIAGFNKPWPDGEVVYSHLNEQLVKTSVVKGIDLVMMAENFCGHGFRAGVPTAPCYRGPNTPLWFDPNTCTHPNTAGHQALAQMFDDVVRE